MGPKNSNKDQEEEKLAFHSGKPWRTLYALYQPERVQLAAALGFFLIKSSPVWVIPVVTANLIDLLAHPAGPSTARSLWINTLVGGVFITQNVWTHVLYADGISAAVRNVECRLRSALCRRLQMLSIAYHHKVSTGVLQTKVLRDVDSVEQLSRQLVDAGLGATTTIIASLLVTAWRMPYLLPAFLVLVPIMVVLRITLSKRLGQLSGQMRQQTERMGARVLGMLDMIPVTRAHAAEADELDRVEQRLGQVRHAGRAFDHQAGYFNALTWVVFMLTNLLCLSAGVWLSYRRIFPLGAGDIILMTGYFNSVIGSVMTLNNMLPVISRGFEALRSIGEVLECPDLEDNLDKQRIAAVAGHFQFEDVSFSYARTEGQEEVLRQLRLEVRAGETLGIVGGSGAGKSTLVSLLIGFHRPTGGRILLDGVDMNAVDLRSFRQHLAVVGQDTLLFQGTLRENILYGARNVTDARLRVAIADANAQELIDRLPRGVHTEIGERGVQLSGGQRQRIAIARALLRNPRVLILDEATSALDAASEAIVQEALERLMVGRTTFIVAHRLTTLRRADRIIVLERGRLVECGTSGELLRQPGSYFARMHALQAPLAAAG